MATVATSRATTVSRVYLIVALFVAIIIGLSLFFQFQLGASVAARVLVGGEGLWAKAQKDAILNLERYTSTRDEADFLAYRHQIQVPLDLHTLRLELEKTPPDLVAARMAGIRAGIHTEDLDYVIPFLLRFQRSEYLAPVIGHWRRGDQLIAALVDVAEQLHLEIAGGQARAETVFAIENRLADINRQVSREEDQFSAALGQASRRAVVMLQWLTYASAVLFTGLGIVLSWSIIKGIRRTESALVESEGRYRGIYECVSEVIYTIGCDGNFLSISPSGQQMTGWPIGEWNGKPFVMVVHPDDQARAMEVFQKALAGQSTPSFEVRIRKSSGQYFDVEHSLVPLTSGGTVTALLGIARDISERKRMELELRMSEAKFAALFSLTPQPMALTRLADGTMLDVSRSYAEYFGYQREELLGRTTLAGDLGFWVDNEQRRHWKEQIERDGEVLAFETSLQRKDGSVGTVLISGKRIEMDAEPCVIVTLHDISERKQHAEYLEQIAHHDPLTGLPNRLLLRDRMRQAIARNRRSGRHVAVCYLDLDGFKDVNDRLGHDVGDQVLIDAGKRLMAVVRSGDTVARLGGDEFVILLSDLADDEECRTALDRLLRTVSAPYAIGDSECRGISASLGVTVFPDDPVDPDTLVRHADHAMYAAKQAGKNRYQMFDARLEQRIELRHATLRELAQALRSGQFCLYYQPKVDCRQGRVVGAEALLRWQHPTLGLLPPAEFIPLIDDSDLALEVGEWVIRVAIEQIGLWQREGIDLRISVNAFARHLLHPGFAETLGMLLKQHPEVRPEYLQIEIVETTALRDLDAIRAVIEDCGKLGVTFSLDDFGTGYSTLTHLRQLPATEIKIDKVFVGQMLDRREDRVIVEAIIGLGQAFNRAVVAEGAETSAHISRLLALGCDVIQGYALARPMAAEKIPGWVREFCLDPAWNNPRVSSFPA